MVQHLRLRWRDDLPIKDLLVLRAELDEMLERIRSTRALEKARTTYRKTAGPDPYGHAATSEPAVPPGCAHADEE
jgi:hypothetical protein